MFFKMFNAKLSFHAHIFPLFLKLVFNRIVPFNSIQSNFTDSIKIFSSITGSYPAIVFLKYYIQNPVQLVFNKPVFTHCPVNKTSLSLQ